MITTGIKMNVLSLFDGFSCGQIALNRIGIKPTKYYASEIDKYAITVTQANYPDTIQLGDVTKWREWHIDWASIDLLIGGFPCQSYSQAGKREGITSANGNLIFSVFEILEKCQPKLFMLENVKGLVSIDRGETFKFILSELNKTGYAIDFIGINSALMSAQNRDRVYIIGKRLDECQGLTYDMELTKESINATLKKSSNGRYKRTLS